MTPFSELYVEGYVFKSGKHAIHGPSRCPKRKKKMMDQMLSEIAGFHMVNSRTYPSSAG